MALRDLLRFSMVLFVFTSAAWTFADEPAKEAYVPKAPLKKLDLQDGDSFVFLGDSITHQCLYTQYVEDFFYQRMPHIRLKFHNSGVGGARAWDALARFDEDVAAYKPKYVSILLGMNDGTYRSYDQATFDAYHRDMTTVVEKIVATGATPLLMTPTMYDSRASRMFPRKGRTYSEGLLTQYNSVLTYYGTWLREVATENGYGFVDMWGPLNNLTIAARKTDPSFTIIKDAIHPDAPGQAVMAVAMIDDLGLKAPLSNIRLQLYGKAAPKATSMGGAVSDLKRTENGVEFTWLAKGLPWVLPEEAAIGCEPDKARAQEQPGRIRSPWSGCRTIRIINRRNGRRNVGIGTAFPARRTSGQREDASVSTGVESRPPESRSKQRPGSQSAKRVATLPGLCSCQTRRPDRRSS